MPIKILTYFFILILSSSKVLYSQDLKFTLLEYDFGAVKQGEKLEYEFQFKNEGLEDLIISKISSPCGCTAAVAQSAVVKPNQKSAIRVIFDTAGFFGEKEKFLRVYSNDLSKASQVLTLKAKIIPELQAIPDRVEVNEISHGTEYITGFSFSRYHDSNIKVRKVVSKSKHLQVSYDSQKDIVQIIVDKETPIGEYRTPVIVLTDSLELKSISVPVFFRVVGDLMVSPQFVDFGRLNRGELVEHSLKIRSRSQKKLDDFYKLEVDHPAAKVKLDKLEDPQSLRTITLRLKTSERSIVRGFISIQFEEKGETVKIPFFAVADFVDE